MRTVFAEQQRMWRRMWSFPRVVEQAFETRVGTTACDVVLEKGTHKLLRYRRETPATCAEPVLFCYALINRHYILDLQPDKSVVRRYLERGFEVYLIDWGVPSDEDHVLTLEDYVCGFLQDSVEKILKDHGRDSLHLFGYCMGGTLAALAAALHPDLTRTLTLVASPIDFSGRESLLNLWTDRKYFDVDAFVDAHGNCPAWFLQSLFLCLRPVANFIEKNIAFYEQMDDPRLVSNYYALELWVNDNIPMAGETFRQFVKDLFQKNQLVRGKFRLGDRRIDLRKITCPLLLLTARNDHLVPPSSTEGIRPHVGTSEIKSITIDAGHVGLIVGSKAQSTVWSEATRWLADRSKAAGKPGKPRSRNR
jgi:polyhydroxyalkanoate synthase